MSGGIKLNSNVKKLSENYLFKEMEEKVKVFSSRNPETVLLRLGVGDVSGTLPECIVAAAERALIAQKETETFRGYGPENGYEFCRNAVRDYYKNEMGAEICSSDVFISDGAKSAIDRLLGCFSCDVVIPSPAYPAYYDCAETKGLKIVALERFENDSFVPFPDKLKKKPYLIILCSPDNPTGVAYDKSVLECWTEFAVKSGSVILFDNAYERFIRGGKPHSIYAVKGAEMCAVEIGSLSKSACFTGMRLGWSVIPDGVAGGALKKTYKRIIGCGYNGAPYIIQRAAECALSGEGIAACSAYITACRHNAAVLKKALTECGMTVYGGLHSPYLWLKCPFDLNSEETFDYFLSNCGIVITPGSGFGKGGDGFVRLSALCPSDTAEKASVRIKEVFGVR